jgi:hypothetical protein
MIIKRCTIPIYEYTLFIALGNIREDRQSLTRYLGDCSLIDRMDDLAGLVSRNNHYFAIFLSDPNDLEVLAHEVFHLTHRVLEYAAVNFDSANHESGALLNGFLFVLVSNTIKNHEKRKRRRLAPDKHAGLSKRVRSNLPKES